MATANVKKMKTLAEFKRDAASGKMSLELYERYGNSDINEVQKGIRKVTRTNTVEIILLNQDGKESHLRFNSAKLVEYDGDTLIIYQAGYRDLTEQEKTVLDEWGKIENEYLRKNPYSDTYWKMKDYFAKSPCSWMSGFETVRGKRYDYTGKVMDNSVKGEAILKYHVYMAT